MEPNKQLEKTNPTEYAKSVLLAFNNKTHRGPGMVVRNLQEGLRRLSVNVLELGDEADYIGYLQPCRFDLLKQWHREKKKVLMGPNLFVLPTEMPEMCNMFSDFVVPGEWVKKKYSQFDLLKDKKIWVWPVGIDTDEWKPTEQKEDMLDCLIYHKNRSEQDLAVAEAICRKFGLTYKTLQYGSYNEDELKTACALSKFAMLVNGTESQGIAYMQILSTNTPCYVFNKSYWKSDDGSINVPATSVPYWSDSCGMVTNDVNLKHFEEFLHNISVDKYSPREYILGEHTLEKSAQKYMNIIEKVGN